MIFEMFFHWLRGLILRDKYCVHEWIETDITYTRWLFSEGSFKHHLKCKNCGKKIKRTPRDVPENTLKNDIYYIS